MTLCLTLTAGVSLAQSLGDVARQERERRSQLVQHARVITNEDLKREQILATSPEEAAAPVNTILRPITPAAAHANPQEVAPVPANVPLWGVAEQPGFSLGAYARALRRKREMRESRNAVVYASAPQLNNIPAQPVSSAEPNAVTPVVAAAAPHRRNERRERSTSPDPGPPLLRAARGDSLWRLARAHLGDGRMWPLLWQANPEIRNPGRLRIGQLLRLPARQLNFAALRDGKYLASIRREMERRSGGANVAAIAKMAPPVTIFSLPSRRARTLPAPASEWAAAGAVSLLTTPE